MSNQTSKKVSNLRMTIYSFIMICIIATCVQNKNEILASIPSKYWNYFQEEDERIKLIDSSVFFHCPTYKNKNIDVSSNVQFSTEEKGYINPFEIYANLDFLGRAREGFCCISYKQVKKMQENNMRKPSGWDYQNDDCLEPCYLIGLTGENTNPKNIIIGTKTLQKEMRKQEQKIINYLEKHKKNHVIYRVYPYYDGANRLTQTVFMDAYSVEDNGKLSFRASVYNVEKGYRINYKTGKTIKA